MFWKNWFKPTSNTPTAQKEMTLAQGSALLLSQEKEKITVWKKEHISRFSEIQTLLDEIYHDLKPLEERSFTSEGENQFLRKVVQTSSTQFVHRMKQLIKKLDVPFTKSDDEQFSYAQQAHATLAAELADFYKSTLYSAILAKSEMKTIGQKMERLENELLTLTNSTKELFSRSFLDAKAEVNSLMAIEQQLERVQNESTRLTQEREKEQQELEETTHQLLQLEKDPLFLDALSQEEKQKKLEKEREGLVQKPILWVMEVEKEWAKLLKSPQNPFSEAEEKQIQHWRTSPQNAFHSDPKGDVFKTLLDKTIVALEKNAISFKSDKEKQKTILNIRTLQKKSFFDEFFWPVNELERELKTISNTLSSDINKGWTKTKTQLSQQIVTQKATIEKMSLEQSKKQEQLESLLAQREELKQKITVLLSNALNQTIQLV